MKDKLLTIDRINFPTFYKALDNYYQNVKIQYTNNLRNSDRIASSNLINNIDYDIEVKDKTVSVKLELLPYWKWIESGRLPTTRSGDGTVRANIKRWIIAKKISIPQKMTLDQLTYAIANKIHKFGFGGTHDLERTLEQLNDRWIPIIKSALLADIKLNLNKLII